MLEMKSILSKMLRKYKFSLSDPDEKLKLVAELVLRSANGFRLKVAHRTS
jgi:hypothetical protein